MFEKRFYPATLALRRLLAAGVLGSIAMVASTGPHKLDRPTRPAWFLDPATYGGIAGDLPIHDIDLVLDLVGEQQGAIPCGTVSAHIGNARADDHPGFDDHVALLLRAGEVPATIEANWLGPEAANVHGHYRMRVTGTLGTAEIDWAYHRLTVTTHDRETWDEPLGPARRPAQYFFDALSAGSSRKSRPLRACWPPRLRSRRSSALSMGVRRRDSERMGTPSRCEVGSPAPLAGPSVRAVCRHYAAVCSPRPRPGP